jgi:hypothetical protein
MMEWSKKMSYGLVMRMSDAGVRTRQWHLRGWLRERETKILLLVAVGPIEGWIEA